ncbi:hypothetical protein SLA2020_059960 [Shorea laevis]
MLPSVLRYKSLQELSSSRSESQTRPPSHDSALPPVAPSSPPGLYLLSCLGSPAAIIRPNFFTSSIDVNIFEIFFGTLMKGGQVKEDGKATSRRGEEIVSGDLEFIGDIKGDIIKEV